MRLLSWSVVLCAFSLLATAACGGSTAGNPATVKDAASNDTGIILPIKLPDAGKDAPKGTPDASTSRDTGIVIVDSGNGGPPPPTDAQANTFPALQPNAPQVVNYGGTVLSAPIFVPIFFANDDPTTTAKLETYLNAIGPSDYWKQAVSEYGVGAGIATAPIVMNETMPPSLTDAQIQTWLANRIGTDPRFGALPGTSVFDAGPFDAGPIDATAPLYPNLPMSALAPTNAIYALFFTSGVSITLGSGFQQGASCSSFGGYHNSFYYEPNGSNVVYAVLPRCSSFGMLNSFDGLTGATSHELAEASTDPFVGGNGTQVAYGGVDDNHFMWEVVLGGGEIGDMCAQFAGAFYNPTEAALAPFTVQRMWSNKNASEGHDPCRPVPAGEPPYYINAVPNLTPVPATFYGQNLTTLALNAPAGQPTTLEVDLFSDATTNGQEWQVQAYDANAFFGGGGADLIFTPSMVNGSNAYKFDLSVSNLNNDGQTTHPFILVSTLGNEQNWWIGAVTN